MKTLNKTTRTELLTHILDGINELKGQNIPVDEMHNRLFNEDYYIIGYYHCSHWLKENYGIFEAIGKIQEYEKSNFGEVNTKLDNSESVLNMLVYILGEELLSEHFEISPDSYFLTDELIEQLTEFN